MIGKVSLTDEDIQKIKLIYPNVPIFKFKDKIYEAIIRPITRPLYDTIRQSIMQARERGEPLPIDAVSNKIFDECVIWPTIQENDKKDFPVGLIPSIVKSVQEKSMLLEVDIFDRPLRPTEYVQILSDYEYWPAPTTEEKEEIKKSMPFIPHLILIDRWSFIIRPLTRADVGIVNSSSDESLAAAKCVTVWPKSIDWDRLPAGIIEILSRAASDASGFGFEAEITEL